MRTVDYHATTASAARRSTSLLVLLVGAVVALDGVRIPTLGFHSDDWAFLGLMANAAGGPGASLVAIFQDTAARPVQSLYLALLFEIFGLAPAWYHVVNHVLFTGAIVLFHLCLKRFRFPAPLAVAWPIVFATLPHYSTTRVWIAASQATLSLFFYFASLYAGLRAQDRTGAFGWSLTKVFAMSASLLAYEVLAPFFLLIPWLEGRYARLFAKPGDGATARRDFVRSLMVVVVVLGAAAWYKSLHSNRIAVTESYPEYASRLFSSSALVNFVNFGVELPTKVTLVVREYAERADFFTAIVVGLLACAACVVAQEPSPPSLWRWGLISIAGVALSLMGYLVFLVTSQIGFAETGVNNRTAIGGALGVALVFVSAAGAVSALARAPSVRRWAYGCGIGVLCFCGSTLNSVVADFWREAWMQQQDITVAVRRDFGVMPSNTTLLLDGVCRYRGPGIVFETGWDVSGMLQVYYRDPSLHGDVISETTSVERDGIVTRLYGDTAHYRFDRHLIAYNASTRLARALESPAAAGAYFAARTPLPECERGLEGFGTPIF